MRLRIQPVDATLSWHSVSIYRACSSQAFVCSNVKSSEKLMRNRVLPIVVGAVLVLGVVLVAIGSQRLLRPEGIQDSLATLQDLPFDEFVDASYKQILLRSPELVTTMCLSQLLGTRDDQLDDICYTYVDETYQLMAGIQDILATHDRSTLDYEQQISYDSYAWLLDDWDRQHDYLYHFYPVTHGFSRQNDLFRFFEDEHPMETVENVEDYIARLWQVDDQFDCLVKNLADSEAQGVMAPAQMLQRAADRVRYVVPGSATNLRFYTALETRSAAIDGLSPQMRQDLLT